MPRSLREFNTIGYMSQKRRLQLILWFFLLQPIFRSKFSFSLLRRSLLSLLGANIGKRVKIRRAVRVHFPWNLSVGNDCWIGEEVWIINHEKVTIGSDVCISQRSIICSGGHDYRSISLKYAHKPITICDGAWICLDAKILPGINIGECSVVSAGEVVRKPVPDYSILIGGNIRPIEPPK